ncbi:MAG: acetoin utilization protein AcuC [Planctomycetes bacterium]|nr:acetoin utilization protein AcuC [Planctomycetota bacterium]
MSNVYCIMKFQPSKGGSSISSTEYRIVKEKVNSDFMEKVVWPLIDMADKVIIHSDELEQFSYPSSCPFNISRAGKVKQLLLSLGMYTGDGAIEAAPVAASREIMEKIHSADYLDELKRAGEGYFETEMLDMGLGTGDCPVFKGMYDYAVLASGATVTGAWMILDGRADAAFNPSGGFHHAHRYSAAGFCYVNDVAMGCQTLTDGGKRVLFLDVDVHHTDGVQEAFYDRSDVMTISLHQDGRTIFPGTGFVGDIGIGAGKGYSVNAPLPMGTYDAAYMKVIRSVVVPLIQAYDPDVIALELGADGLSGDPLAAFNLSNNVYADVIALIQTFGKPILAVGGGGYNIENTVRAWALCWTALCGKDNPHESMEPGGVMTESTEWYGGLRDREIFLDEVYRKDVDPQIDRVIEEIKQNVFDRHGL